MQQHVERVDFHILSDIGPTQAKMPTWIRNRVRLLMEGWKSNKNWVPNFDEASERGG
jgi:hypothetical protein